LARHKANWYVTRTVTLSFQASNLVERQKVTTEASDNLSVPDANEGFNAAESISVQLIAPVSIAIRAIGGDFKAEKPLRTVAAAKDYDASSAAS